MSKLRSLYNSWLKKKKPKVRRKAGGERENKPMVKRPDREADTIRRSRAPKKKSIVKKQQVKPPVKKVTPTEVATNMKARNKK